MNHRKKNSLTSSFGGFVFKFAWYDISENVIVNVFHAFLCCFMYILITWSGFASILNGTFEIHWRKRYMTSNYYNKALRALLNLATLWRKLSAYYNQIMISYSLNIFVNHSMSRLLLLEHVCCSCTCDLRGLNGCDHF